MASKAEATNVRVVCRFRPFNSKELALGGTSIVNVDEAGTTIKINGAESNHTFSFDRIFVNSSQKDVYDYSAKPVVEDILRGYNGTIFVYGQTSSGKTHTMQGPNIDDHELKGIIPRMNGTIFESIANADPDIEFLVKASYIEIYMEKIRDLLNPANSNLKVREEKTKGIWVEGCTESYVSSESDVLDVITTGSQNRAIAETKMNSESSRSHSIFILTVNQKHLKDMSNKTGKMYLVDLAGSEKVEKTGAQGTTLDEAKMINKSLSALGNVINALTEGKVGNHIPYRDSKLTRVLQESLGGNSRTTLIINCSPAPYNEAETLSTLRFGNRAKNIKNTAKVNAEKSVAELKIALAKADKEIERLESKITLLEQERAILGNGGTLPDRASTGSIGTPNMGNASAVINTLQDKVLELETSIKKLDEEKKSVMEMHENFVEEMKEKESELEMSEIYKKEIDQLKQTEEEYTQENELLIIKLADMTIANEKMQFENNEQTLQLESLTVQNNALTTELGDLKSKIESLTTENNKLHQREEEEEEKKELDSSRDSKGAIQSAKAEHELLTALRVEIESQRSTIEVLRKEKDLQDTTIKRYEIQLGQVERKEGDIVTADKSPSMDTRMERELQQVREQTNQKLLEFDALKTALLRDLENRCQKVIELEILLDEAREQYQTLLVQVKNSNSKTLQQKCVFLQRNLEQLTAVQQQLVNENNRLKLENQVCVKQLAIRNERIHGLELLLQDAQEKLQKHAQSNESNLKEKTASFKQTGLSTRKPTTLTANNLQQGGRIAKPIRGGGGNPTAKPSSDDGDKKQSTGGSIWDIFRSKNQKPEGENGHTPSLSASKTTVNSAEK